jgi:hypothetical protein
MWNLWKLRNNLVFNRGVPEVSSLLEDIKAFLGFGLRGVMAEKLVFLFRVGALILWLVFNAYYNLLCIVND